MTTRYTIARPLSRARLKCFVALDNMTAQPVLIEIVKGDNGYCKIWTAYNPDRNLGTYTAVYPNGRVSTVTVYPGGRVEERLNRGADKLENVKRVRRKAVELSKGAGRNAAKAQHRGNV